MCYRLLFFFFFSFFCSLIYLVYFLMRFLPRCSRLNCFLSVSMKKCFMIISVLLAFRFVSSNTSKTHPIQRAALFVSLVYTSLYGLVPYVICCWVFPLFLCLEGLFRGWKVDHWDLLYVEGLVVEVFRMHVMENENVCLPPQKPIDFGDWICSL